MTTLGSAQIFKIQDSTIAEIRAMVAVTGDLPGDAVVRARVGFGNTDGAKIRRLHIAAVR